MFKKCGDVAPSDMVSGHGRGGLIVGLGDLLVVFSTLNDSVIFLIL